MVSIETVEINPTIDEHKRTATLGVELASRSSARNPVAFRQPPFLCHHKSASFVGEGSALIPLDAATRRAHHDPQNKP
jgi:hypothetical protein